MHLPSVAVVMVHVSSPVAGLDWYEKAFPTARRQVIEESGFECLALEGTRIEVVKADDKVSSGASGTVVYWQVDDLEASLVLLQNLGAKLYRGPMKVQDGETMCQVQDPWGNCWGLRGRLR